MYDFKLSSAVCMISSYQVLCVTVGCLYFFYSEVCNDIITTGSPFQFTVGPITDGGAHKVRAIGPGLERGEVNKPCKPIMCLSYRDITCTSIIIELSTIVF